MKPNIGLAIGKPSEIPNSHQNYMKSLASVNAEPTYIRPGDSVKSETIDGLLIMGGPDIHPSQYGEENIGCQEILGSDSLETLKQVYLKAVDRQIPIMGICMGMQFINIMHGGSLVQHMEKPHSNGDLDVEIEVRFIENEILAMLFGKRNTTVKCHHHQCIKKVGTGLSVIAYSEDGTIEAIQNKDYPFLLGVEWHPERTHSEVSHQLFERFANECTIQRELRARQV